MGKSIVWEDDSESFCPSTTLGGGVQRELLSQEGKPQRTLGPSGQGLVPRHSQRLTRRTSFPGNPACSSRMKTAPPRNPLDLIASDPGTSASPNVHCTDGEAEAQKGAVANLESHNGARISQSLNPLGLRLSTYEMG